MTQDALDLLHGYLNETLSEPDFARLQKLLQENADARRTLRSLSTVDAKLQQVATFNPATLLLLGEPAVSKTKRDFPWLSWRPLTAAAAVLILSGLVLLFWPEKAAVRLAAISGEVMVSRSQTTIPGKVGFVLREGDWLITGKDGAAEIEFPGETTRLKIGAHAEFGVVAALPSKELKLTAGSLSASVARQSASHPMMIRTPTAKAEVLGTKFEMNATKETTRMTVTEGRVLIARTDDENGVVVEAQQTADVSEKEPVRVQPMPVTQTLATGLIARWNFDEGVGVTSADSSGNGHTLTLNKEGAWGEGRFGKALDLHAVPVAALSTPVELPGAFTISMWQRIEPGGPARLQPLFTSDGEANRMNSLWLIMPPSSPGSGIVLGVSGPQMNSQARAKAGVILAGRWQHVAVCVDGVEGRATFFVDGRDVSMATGLRAGFKLKAPVLIGRRFKDGPMPFDGQIDDVRIYGRILSGEEISALAAEPAISK